MRASAYLDLPWYFGGGFYAGAGLRSSFGPQMEAAAALSPPEGMSRSDWAKGRWTSPTPSISKAEDAMIQRCVSAFRVGQIERRLRALVDRHVHALRLHFVNTKRLPGGISPAAILSERGQALAAKHELFGYLEKAKPEVRLALSEETNVLVDEAIAAYEGVALEQEAYSTWDDPKRAMRIQYT